MNRANKNSNHLMKVKWNLIDTSFEGSNSSVAGVESSHTIWNKDSIDPASSTFYVNDCIYRIRENKTPKNRSYGFLLESPAIIPDVYKHAYRVVSKFDLFFTHNSSLLKYSNTRWIPGGGVWIGGNYGLGEFKIFEKDKLVSMVSSSKRMCPLHEFRLQVLEAMEGISIVDIFGSAKGSWSPINLSLERYFFSIIIENYVDDLYFTEKLNNCFATGTVPIYYGARYINKIYNEDGIITFGSLGELLKIIQNLSKEDYYNRRNAIQDNYDRCKEFISIEDYIYKNYFSDKAVPLDKRHKKLEVYYYAIDKTRQYIMLLKNKIKSILSW